MTTVAFRKGKMASDSRCSESNIIVARVKKIFRLSNGGLYGNSGGPDCRELLLILDKFKNPKVLPSKKELASTQTQSRGIWVFPKGQAYYVDVDNESKDGVAHWVGQITEVSEDFAAVGSGAEFALGAFVNGASAERAVWSACKFDIYSGGPIVSMSLIQPIPKKKVAQK